MISRQPMRCANEPSLKASRVAPAPSSGVGSGADELAHDAHRRQPARTRRERQPGGLQRRHDGCSVGGQGQLGGNLRALGGSPRRRLGLVDLAVAIEVECGPCLERRDLGLVDDDIEQDSIDLDPDPGVVVDREVAERMRQHEGRDQQRRGDRDERAEAATSALMTERQSAAETSHGAEGTRSGARRMKCGPWRATAHEGTHPPSRSARICGDRTPRRSTHPEAFADRVVPRTAVQSQEAEACPSHRGWSPSPAPSSSP